MSRYDDDRVKELLRSMPPVRDTRSKEEVLHRLKGDERMNQNRLNERKKRKRMPIVIGLVALLVLALLAPSWFKERESSQQIAEQDVSVDQNSESIQSFTDGENGVAEEGAKARLGLVEESRTLIGKYALYEADLKQFVPLRLGLVTDDALSVPVSILIPKQRVSADLKSTTPTSLQLYEQYVKQIDEEELGFTPYHPYDATFEENDKVLTMRIRDPLAYTNSSAQSEIFMTTLEQTFYGYSQLLLLEEDGEMATLGGIGVQTEPLALNSAMNRYAFYRYEHHGMTYLAPSFGAKYSTVEEALDAMRDAENDLYTSVIPEGVAYTFEMDDDRVIVTFKEELDVNAYTLEEAYLLIEGLNMTVSNFGKQLQLANVKQGTWEKFDLRRPIPKALSANPLRYHFDTP